MSMSFVYYLDQAVVAALLVVVILWRRQSKQGIALGFVRLLGVYTIALVSCLTCVVGLVTLSHALGFPNNKWVLQSFWILAALIAYLMGGQMITRLRRA